MMMSGKVSPVLGERTLQKTVLVNPFEKHPSKTSETTWYPKWAGRIHKEEGFAGDSEAHCERETDRQTDSAIAVIIVIISPPFPLVRL